jgi:hypothetical protein
MAIKVILTPFFAMPLSSGVNFVQRPLLPRDDKQKLEMSVAGTLLSSLPANEQVCIRNLRPNPADPPDVLFDLNGTTIGIELVELVPRNRLGKDAVLDDIRDRILDLLVLGEPTKNRVIFLHLVDTYSEQLQIKDCAQAVAALINAELKSQRNRCIVPTLSPELRRWFHSICIETYDLNGHPQISREFQPLIVFSAEATFVIPDEDFPKILEHTVRRKLLHDLANDTWLLIWTDNQAMSGACEELFAHITRFLGSRTCNYKRVFLATFGFMNEVKEFYLPQ